MRKNKNKERGKLRKGGGQGQGINGPLFYLATSKCKKVHL